ncbi:SDR family NAD(P)-dependent oxidoreductase [Phyllobacterium salinisoli]|uniref:SDR family NAD(P)-dependent oxidoreductase n=1 Tax=Phyllobacterium salinisoli TaxID=1899321 RepID=A0A368K2C2_9HYPH|nr:SDR family oxidoreductase [Phyllobacterium salinisoli]RCS22130.1 SDR family NAD(P)-dependent oxidoreductase [Phyllobacterium salinisoli]
MDLGLNDKTALVFGAGGGLGGAIARSLAAEGVCVIVADIDGTSAEATAKAIVSEGGRAIPMIWDIGDISLIEGKLAEIKAAFGPVDILVNNTGGPPPTSATGQSPDIWSKYFDMMVRSVIAVTDGVLPSMRERKWGRIITSTSSGVVAPIANLAISNSLRLALVGWSKTLAREVGRDGITANIVLPGRLATGRIVFLDEQKAKRENRAVSDVTTESTASIPVGRYGDPKEYGDTVTFLASSRASYITGSVIRVDGGLINSI